MIIINVQPITDTMKKSDIDSSLGNLEHRFTWSAIHVVTIRMYWPMADSVMIHKGIPITPYGIRNICDPAVAGVILP